MININKTGRLNKTIKLCLINHLTDFLLKSCSTSCELLIAFESSFTSGTFRNNSKMIIPIAEQIASIKNSKDGLSLK